MNFPDELDTDFYKNAYSDLKEFNQEQLIKHYFDYGKEEGRAGNSIINRKDFINIIKLHYYEKFGLEIGPLNNPAFSKDMNVKYADLLSFEKLKKKAIEHKLDETKVPKIDYILNNVQGLSIIKNKFDFIYSAHLIEHQVCLLKHLNQIEKILKKNMFYFLVVPDSRYCFDKFKKLSTISDVFDQFYSKSQSVRLKNLIDTYYLDTHNDADIHWKNKVNKNNLLPPFSIERIIDAIDVYKKNTYIDVHSWHFTPDSFSKILNILFITDYTTLKIERIYPTRKNTQEFFAILKNV